MMYPITSELGLEIWTFAHGGGDLKLGM